MCLEIKKYSRSFSVTTKGGKSINMDDSDSPAFKFNVASFIDMKFPSESENGALLDCILRT